MKKFIEINDEQFLLTERGQLKAKELQIGDKVIGDKVGPTIKNIIKCGNRPNQINFLI